jgi:serine/threonine protein phosphatase PrpC
LSTNIIRYAAAAVTDVGIKRPSNEDAYGLSVEDGVYIVCDGMGGAAAGEIASSMATQEVLRRLSTRPETAPLEDLVDEAVFAANEAIHSRAQSNPQLNGMGTTLVGVVTEGNRALVFNVGDSRCYRLREAGAKQNGESRLEQISLDHSLVEEQVRMGRLTHEEAQHSSYRNVITRALGTQHSVEPDKYELEAAPGEIFLLCSDGLTGEIDDAQIEAILSVDRPLDELCARLVDAAKRAGGRDNITCLLVRAESLRE